MQTRHRTILTTLAAVGAVWLISLGASLRAPVRRLNDDDVTRFIVAYRARQAPASDAAVAKRLGLIRANTEDAGDWVRELAPAVRAPQGARYLPSCSRSMTLERGQPIAVFTFDQPADERLLANRKSDRRPDPSYTSPQADRNRALVAQAVRHFTAAGLSGGEEGWTTVLHTADAVTRVLVSEVITVDCPLAPTGASIVVIGEPRAVRAADPEQQMGGADYRELAESLISAWNDYRDPRLLVDAEEAAQASQDVELLTEVGIRKQNVATVARFAAELAPIMDALRRIA